MMHILSVLKLIVMKMGNSVSPDQTALKLGLQS